MPASDEHGEDGGSAGIAGAWEPLDLGPKKLAEAWEDFLVLCDDMLGGG